MLFGYSTSIEAGDDLKEMKNSGIEWIGEIPADWKTIKSKYCICISNGSDPKTEGSTPVYGSGAESFKTCGEYKIGPAVLLGRKGATLHIPHYIEGNYWNVDTAFDATHFCGNINLKFYYYCACVFDYAGYISQTTLPGMTQTNYKNMSIPFPQLEVQERIAIFLDEKCSQIDAIIARQQEVIEKLKAYKLSIITETVTKGLNPDVAMKDSGIEWIGEIPEHWEIVRLKLLGTARNGLTYSPSDICDANEGILVLRSSNIQNGQLTFDDNVYVSCEIKDDLMVRPGDILICSRNGSRKLIGKNAIINDTIASFGAFMMIFRTNQNPKYIKYILDSSIFMYYLGTFLTSTINQLTGANFNSMKIPFTWQTDEQETIVNYLDAKCTKIEHIISIKQSKIDKLTAYKKSLIYEVVTGKKEV